MAGVQALFSELDEVIKDGRYEEALTISQKILKQDPRDQDALQCQAFCLLQLGQFEQAVQVFQNCSNPSQFLFERAYCAYRLKNFTQALDLLHTHPEPNLPKVLELEAQVLYGLERFEESANIYESLVEDKKVESVPELETNLCAALCLAGTPSKARSFISSHKNTLAKTFEFAYNAACVSIASNDVVSAEKELAMAERLCRKNLNDGGCTEEEIEDELAPILTQTAYVHQIQNKIEEATRLYNSVLKHKPSDEAVVAIAFNNLAVINKDHDLFDSEKKLKMATSEKVQLKLTTPQIQAITYNQCLLLLYMDKIKQCEDLLATLQERFRDSSSTTFGWDYKSRLALLSASVRFRKKKFSESESLLKAEISNLGERHNTEELMLALAQIHLSKPGADVEEVIRILRSITSLQHKPGMTSFLVALYEQLHDINGAIQVLDDCVAWWDTNKKGPEDIKTHQVVLKASAAFKLRNGLYEQASAVYKLLLGSNRNDSEALINLILACAEFDNQQAEEYASRIPPFKMESVADAESLENLPTPLPISQKRKEESAKSAEVKTKTEKKKKKKRKPRYPKNYNPASNITPDPERWKPKRERSYYKPRRGQRNQIGRGPQGSVGSSAGTSTGGGAVAGGPPAASPAGTGRNPSQPRHKPSRGRRGRR